MHDASEVCVRERVMRMHRDARERDRRENARVVREKERVNERLRDRRAMRISRLRRRRTSADGRGYAARDKTFKVFRPDCLDKKLHEYRVSRRDARP